MMRRKRKIIKIDEEKCDGCGLCIPSCPEGALKVINGKVRLVKESFCDGLGACIGYCPKGALSIEEREAEEYDEEGVITHIKETSPELLEKHLEHMREHAHELPLGLLEKVEKYVHEIPTKHPTSHAEISVCPSAHVQYWRNEEVKEQPRIISELHQWPIKLRLVSVKAPYFQNADFVLVADCVPFAYANFHTDFMKGKAIATGCPKLDDISDYVDKIEQIIRGANIKSLNVIHMEVPCCYGLVHIAREALNKSGKDVPFEDVTIGIKGEVIAKKRWPPLGRRG
ncbi:MAG: 4Fe-4S binding protein [Candidatus Verstraetearchaeota archaeon]|jgi:Fe-S-cluster-containing hydrogenase component 2|nr:4Fe-4S binding protein [Candidatus Verstraetearchaeota archaeon]